MGEDGKWRVLGEWTKLCYGNSCLAEGFDGMPLDVREALIVLRHGIALGVTLRWALKISNNIMSHRLLSSSACSNFLKRSMG